MNQVFAAPQQLIESLFARNRAAREELHRILRKPLTSLLNKLASKHSLQIDSKRLVEYALHSIETFLRTRKIEDFSKMSWLEFQANVLLHAGKIVLRPSSDLPRDSTSPDSLPACDLYRCDSYYRPAEKIGDFFVGGDWYCGSTSEDGSLWILIADVTGHGYSAYLLACNLPNVWRTCWGDATGDKFEPIHLIEAMHQLLENCLPEGIFVEATLSRFSPDGAVTVFPAGGSRMMSRRAKQNSVNLHTLRGSWLGLASPDPADQLTILLEADDELLMGTDGLFDQLTCHTSERADTDGLTSRMSGRATLFADMKRILDEALKETPQADDITMVSMQRCAALKSFVNSMQQGRAR